MSHILRSVISPLSVLSCLAMLTLPGAVSAHNIICEHTHVNAFRVHCAPDFAECTSGNKPGRCITQKTAGLIPTWDCNCVVSDASAGKETIHDEILSGRCDEQKSEKKMDKKEKKSE